ncbi:thioredoxin domain-containing protein [Qipengyuania mesophila]|uniref:DsbA family protein n=1 Tax=Qipengyuania mesophila TaxID=2867246 RepID=A0ABS7JRL7_9SPHN|nr:DsbA family protein [Qipengyuania mesophila]
MTINTGILKALALASAVPLAIAAGAADKPILPGGNWAGMLTETEGGHLFGNPQAKTKLVEFMSYTCSHCAHFAQTGDGAIKIAYVPTGRISYEIRHLIRDPVDLTAALLTQCGDAKKFGGNHDAIMYRYDEWIEKARTATRAQQSRWQFGSLSARLQAIASDLDFYDIMERRGYTRAQLDKCLSDEAQARAIAETSAADVRKYGLTGTPSFILDGTLLDAHDWNSLEPQLKKAL